MPTVSDLSNFLETFAPAQLAEEWDNVGLLVGDRSRPVERVMTCLTITPDSAAEAIAERANLIVTHHPLPFHPLKRLTADTTPGRLLLDLIAAGVAIHSPHTAFDSARSGINQRLAEGLGLVDVLPLNLSVEDSRLRPVRAIAATRHARRPSPAGQSVLASRSGAGRRPARSTAAHHRRGLRACRAILEVARQRGCDALLTGETSFHTCLEAEATGTGLLLCGHYASERFGVEALAEVLAQKFPGVAVWPSRREHDPLRWV